MSADNPFASMPADVTAPSRAAFAVTPSDSTDLPNFARALYIGGAGNVAVNMIEGGTVTFVGAQAGTWLPIGVSRVLSTGTTATSIIALR